MGDIKETTFDILDCDDFINVFTAEKKWINKINKLHDEHPDDVIIKHVNPDGSLTATIPISYLSVRPPRKISEEQKENLANRMKEMKGLK